MYLILFCRVYSIFDHDNEGILESYFRDDIDLATFIEENEQRLEGGETYDICGAVQHHD